MDHWTAHSRYYDLFQMAFSKYREMLEFHRKNLKKSNKILDSGAGTGNLTILLLKDKHDVVAVDSNPYALQILKEKCVKYSKQLLVREADLTKPLRFDDESFDGVASSLVIPFVSNLSTYFSEIYRTLKENGILSISMPLPKEGVLDYVMSNTKKDAEKEKILPKYEKEWLEIWKTVNKNGELIRERNIDEKRVIAILTKTGFKNIEIAKNPYEGFFLFLMCTK